MNIWQVLEIEVTTDLSQIKRAYANKLKKCKPEIDPHGFQLLRKAYEIAQKYAAGVKVNFDMAETEPNPIQNGPDSQKEAQNQFNIANPMKVVFSLLDVLMKSELEAINLLLDLNKQGVFDNLEFAEEFQRVLVFNLLTITPGYYAFIVHAIDLFNWYEQANREPKNSFFGLALTNLFNQVRPYQFYLKLQFLSQIKNKKRAKQEQLDWYQCYAAKILLNRARPIKFFFIRNYKKKQAILKLLGEIEYNYPQLIGMGLSISSVAWWFKYKQNPDRRLLNIGLICVCLIYIVGFVGKYYENNFELVIKSPNSSLQKNAPITSGQNELLLNNIGVKQVTGDYETNPLWTERIDNKQFKSELISGLGEAGLYGGSANTRYSLKVNLDQFIKSNNATTCRVHYTLIDNHTHKVIYSEAILTTTMGQSLTNLPLKDILAMTQANIKKLAKVLTHLPEEAFA